MVAKGHVKPKPRETSSLAHLTQKKGPKHLLPPIDNQPMVAKGHVKPKPRETSPAHVSQKKRPMQFLPPLVNELIGVKLAVKPTWEATFCRAGLSQTLHKPSKGFNLEDPNMFLFKPVYNKLHAKSLEEYVQNPQRKKFLKKEGYITSDNKVTCSLAEYNKYNDYLKSVNVFNARKCGGTQHAPTKGDVREKNSAVVKVVEASRNELVSKKMLEKNGSSKVNLDSSDITCSKGRQNFSHLVMARRKEALKKKALPNIDMEIKGKVLNIEEDIKENDVKLETYMKQLNEILKSHAKRSTQSLFNADEKLAMAAINRESTEDELSHDEEDTTIKVPDPVEVTCLENAVPEGLWSKGKLFISFRLSPKSFNI
uniref:Uncharacterized protein n=1 Tax=Eptatretus burgeri TaxID=7764 RepID=A0A8C4WZU4_EPTBU